MSAHVRRIPVQSGPGLVLEEHHQFPKTEAVPAPTDKRLMRHARISCIGEVPDGSDRQYVPDLNGPMYLLTRGQRSLHLDVKAQFPDLYSGRGMGSPTPVTPSPKGRDRAGGGRAVPPVRDQLTR
ncbi:hypothetical protein EKO23_15470 [Nocardioides guangzhouensis]|uniref:Uncharacterized protein n=1 Tax=Nocardioides guangzhouensis TaxID=2497878 RepID=A0A4Q4ZBI2_9ACTN|nr:hypothetical protein [Nocardioides guangzhouensis]RYP84661.1 hypothetical protein EKO23_15470 [Nocardioides guangzhouensis]